VSATGRGAARNPHDYYPTPAWCIRRILETVPLPRGTWLEPSAGPGAIVKEMLPYCDQVVALELREECRLDLLALTPNVGIGDALAKPWPEVEVLVANPPYGLSDEFVRKAVESAQHSLFLLRLNWLAARPRVAWLQTHTPDVYILTERPSFNGTGERDATSYAWMHWHKGSTGSLRWLPPTPVIERRIRKSLG
jgi:hypothetical protein